MILIRGVFQALIFSKPCGYFEFFTASYLLLPMDLICSQAHI